MYYELVFVCLLWKGKSVYYVIIKLFDEKRNFFIIVKIKMVESGVYLVGLRI